MRRSEYIDVASDETMLKMINVILGKDCQELRIAQFGGIYRVDVHKVVAALLMRKQELSLDVNLNDKSFRSLCITERFQMHKYSVQQLKTITMDKSVISILQGPSCSGKTYEFPKLLKSMDYRRVLMVVHNPIQHDLLIDELRDAPTSVFTVDDFIATRPLSCTVVTYASSILLRQASNVDFLKDFDAIYIDAYDLQTELSDLLCECIGKYCFKTVKIFMSTNVTDDTYVEFRKKSEVSKVVSRVQPYISIDQWESGTLPDLLVSNVASDFYGKKIAMFVPTQNALLKSFAVLTQLGYTCEALSPAFPVDCNMQSYVATDFTDNTNARVFIVYGSVASGLTLNCDIVIDSGFSLDYDCRRTQGFQEHIRQVTKEEMLQRRSQTTCADRASVYYICSSSRMEMTIVEDEVAVRDVQYWYAKCLSVVCGLFMNPRSNVSNTLRKMKLSRRSALMMLSASVNAYEASFYLDAEGDILANLRNKEIFFPLCAYTGIFFPNDLADLYSSIQTDDIRLKSKIYRFKGPSLGSKMDWSFVRYAMTISTRWNVTVVKTPLSKPVSTVIISDTVCVEEVQDETIVTESTEVESEQEVIFSHCSGGDTKLFSEECDVFTDCDSEIFLSDTEDTEDVASSKRSLACDIPAEEEERDIVRPFAMARSDSISTLATEPSSMFYGSVSTADTSEIHTVDGNVGRVVNRSTDRKEIDTGCELVEVQDVFETIAVPSTLSAICEEEEYVAETCVAIESETTSIAQGAVNDGGFSAIDPRETEETALEDTGKKKLDAALDVNVSFDEDVETISIYDVLDPFLVEEYLKKDMLIKTKTVVVKHYEKFLDVTIRQIAPFVPYMTMYDLSMQDIYAFRIDDGIAMLKPDYLKFSMLSEPEKKRTLNTGLCYTSLFSDVPTTDYMEFSCVYSIVNGNSYVALHNIDACEQHLRDVLKYPTALMNLFDQFLILWNYNVCELLNIFTTCVNSGKELRCDAERIVDEMRGMSEVYCLLSQHGMVAMPYRSSLTSNPWEERINNWRIQNAPSGSLSSLLNVDDWRPLRDSSLFGYAAMLYSMKCRDDSEPRFSNIGVCLYTGSDTFYTYAHTVKPLPSIADCVLYNKNLFNVSAFGKKIDVYDTTGSSITCESGFSHNLHDINKFRSKIPYVVDNVLDDDQKEFIRNHQPCKSYSAEWVKILTPVYNEELGRTELFITKPLEARFDNVNMVGYCKVSNMRGLSGSVVISMVDSRPIGLVTSVNNARSKPVTIFTGFTDTVIVTEVYDIMSRFSQA
ncbi:unnamed protein product [Rhizopus stolonifer]